MLRTCVRAYWALRLWYSFDFYVLGDVTLMSGEPLTQTEQMSCVYHSRTKGEGCDNVKSI